jgi:HAD superfamily hydrolase (TIGR01509 family)
MRSSFITQRRPISTQSKQNAALNAPSESDDRRKESIAFPAAVLFDMDGLLVDTEEAWYAAELEVMRRLDTPWGRDHQKALVGGSLEATSDYMRRWADTDVPAATIRQWLVDFMVDRLAREPVHWRPGARALLEGVLAAGVPSALVSASPRRIVDVVLDRVLHDVRAPFDVTVAGDEVSRTKPDPLPYLTAAARLGVAPTQCVVLEDSANGARAGVAAGCVTVMIPSVGEAPALPTLVVAASLELLDVHGLASIVAESRPPV